MRTETESSWPTFTRYGPLYLSDLGRPLALKTKLDSVVNFSNQQCLQWFASILVPGLAANRIQILCQWNNKAISQQHFWSCHLQTRPHHRLLPIWVHFNVLCITWPQFWPWSTLAAIIVDKSHMWMGPMWMSSLCKCDVMICIDQ